MATFSTFRFVKHLPLLRLHSRALSRGSAVRTEKIPSELMVPQTKEITKAKPGERDVHEFTALSQIPKEYTSERRVRIFIPSKSAMQSGTFNTKKWRLEFDTRSRWENPTMGWQSNADAVSNLNMDFSNKEDAMLFCKHSGWTYTIEEPHGMNQKPKSYGANFSWNKRTRRSTK